MSLGRPGLRLFLLLLAVALPPLGAFAWLNVQDATLLTRLGAVSEFLVLAFLTAIWAALIQVGFSRLLGSDQQAMLDVAARGSPGSGTTMGDGRSTGAIERLAAMLEERNRQIAELAFHVRAVPIHQDLPTVARATVSAVVSVTHDPTWTLVVLSSPDDGSLPRGVYAADGEGPPGAVEDVHRWAATLPPGDEGTPSVRQGMGPWGAFASVEVASTEGLGASLLAPWEGRPTLSHAEKELLSLLGQNAATAIEHALLYARLRLQTEELNRMATVQTDFLRSVTHDLQTPLTSIRAAAAELREQPGLSDTARADLDTVAHQADRLRRMVGQLLIASRLEVGAVQPVQDVFRIEPIVRRTWEALRADRPFTLEVSGKAHLVVADQDRLEQVLWALLDNAVKYSPASSPVSVSVSGEAEPSGRLRSEVSVRDEGSGMDQTTQNRAFEQFYRSANARRLAPDGSGVGLFAAKGLIEAMGGSITITSRLGEGTTVSVSLQAEPLDEVPAPS